MAFEAEQADAQQVGGAARSRMIYGGRRGDPLLPQRCCARTMWFCDLKGSNQLIPKAGSFAFVWVRCLSWVPCIRLGTFPASGAWQVPICSFASLCRTASIHRH